MNLRNTLNFLATSNFHKINNGNFVTAYQFDLQRKGVELFSNVLNAEKQIHERIFLKAFSEKGP